MGLILQVSKSKFFSSIDSFYQKTTMNLIIFKASQFDSIEHLFNLKLLENDAPKYSIFRRRAVLIKLGSAHYSVIISIFCRQSYALLLQIR